jgi:two-component system, NarL family, response regulator
MQPVTAPVNPPLRLLVADDHPVVRAGLVAMLTRESEMTVACEAADGDEAVTAWREHAPDLGFIDLCMPGLDGVATIEAIRAHDASARVVILTTFDGDEDVYRALRAGAIGYLLKDCGRDELLACIRAVIEGHRYLQPAVAACLAERITHTALTAREADVLSWLARGLSNKCIAAEMAVAEGTVKTHVKSLLGKLGAASRTQAVCLAQQRGLVHAASNDAGAGRGRVTQRR